jgi:hypothetical protein
VNKPQNNQRKPRLNFKILFAFIIAILGAWTTSNFLNPDAATASPYTWDNFTACGDLGILMEAIMYRENLHEQGIQLYWVPGKERMITITKNSGLKDGTDQSLCTRARFEALGMQGLAQDLAPHIDWYDDNHSPHTYSVLPFYLDAAGTIESGYGIKKDPKEVGCYNPVKYDVPTTDKAWELDTGSWTQINNNRIVNEQAWVPQKEELVSNAGYIYFAHSGAAWKTKGASDTNFKSTKQQGTGATMNVDLTYTLTFRSAKEPGNPTDAIQEATTIPMFGDGANCKPPGTAYWGGDGWEFAGSSSPNLTTFNKDNGVHWGLRGAKDQEHAHLCELIVDKDKVNEYFASHSDIKEIHITSQIATNISGADSSQNPAFITPGVSSSATAIIKPDSPEWSVITNSYAMVTNLDKIQTPITGCTVNAYCPGPSGVGSGSITKDEATIYVAAEPDESADDKDGGSFDLNFKHTVTVEGDKNTGTNTNDSQLWFYKIRNYAYEGSSSVALSTPYDCLSSHTGFGADNGKTASYQSEGPLQQWNPIVLEAGKTYDILSRSKTTVNKDTAEGATKLCATDIIKKKDKNVKNAKYRSTVYLCFTSAGKYTYGYGSGVSNQYTAARQACEVALQEPNNTSAWNAGGGKSPTLVTSTATVLYEKKDPCKDQTYADAHPEECPQSSSESELAITKTQTCAVNDTLSQFACDPKDTNPDNPEPDEFQAITTETASGDPHGVPTQLARPGDNIHFIHFFDKAAQKLADTTEWTHYEVVAGQDTSKCNGSGSFYYGGTMPSTSIECIEISGPVPAWEVELPYSHSSATDATGSPSASGTNVLKVADNCFYTGKNNEQILSIHSIKANIPALNSLKIISGCSDDPNLEQRFTSTAPISNEDVGSKEIFQKVTLYDRVAQKLANCKKDDCKATYKTEGQKDSATDTQNGTGEGTASDGAAAIAEHKVSVEWKNEHTGNCGGSDGYDCRSTCSETCTYYGDGDCGENSCGCDGSCTRTDGDQDSGEQKYTEYQHVWVKLVDKGPVSSNAQFNIPYNYHLQPDISPTPITGRMLPGGSRWQYSTKITVEQIPNNEFGESYATITRPNTEWKITEFYIDENVTYNPNPADIRDSNPNPCTSYTHANSGIPNVSFPCQVVEESGQAPLNVGPGRNAAGGDVGYAHPRSQHRRRPARHQVLHWSLRRRRIQLQTRHPRKQRGTSRLHLWRRHEKRLASPQTRMRLHLQNPLHANLGRRPLLRRPSHRQIHRQKPRLRRHHLESLWFLERILLRRTRRHSHPHGFRCRLRTRPRHRRQHRLSR